MTPTIRIDDEVFELLNIKSREMDKRFPSPNDVLRNILGLPVKEKPSHIAMKAPPRRPGGRPKTR